MYQNLWSIYDQFMNDVDYKAWAHYLENIIKTYCKTNGKSVVDVACGTGSISILLAKAGYSVTGVDVSYEMLEQAGNNARNAGLRIPFINQNMTELSLHKQADVITVVCDGINYLTKNDDVACFFKKAYNNLTAGGLLLFDVSTDKKIKEVLENNAFHDIRDDCAFIWQNSFDDETDILTLDLTMFIKSEDDVYSRLDEIQYQKAYSKETLQALLTDTGFTLLDIEDIDFNKSIKDYRWQFIALKK